MFTCDEEIGADATDLFNYLTGYSAKKDFRKLIVAPINMRSRITQMIEREITHQTKDGNGHLIFKVNHLVDKNIIQTLYRASQAGVKIDLFVRGMCALRPGIEGVSENIRVLSVVGRFLEHSRVYYFENKGKPEIYLGSADLMPRNLNGRVEVLFPVQDPKLVQYLREGVLDLYLSDNVKARRMGPDGVYTRPTRGTGDVPVNVQTKLLGKHIGLGEES
jgi:polyphosphate kinase